MSNATTFYGYDSAFAAGAAANKPWTYVDYLNKEYEDWIYDYAYADPAVGAWIRANETIRNAFNEKAIGRIKEETFQSVVEQTIKRGRSRGGPGSSGPTTAQRASNIAAEIKNIAKMFGLPDQDWNAIAWQAANNNWDVEKIRDVLADQITADTAKNPGYVNDMISKTRSYAADYMVRVSDEEALQFAKQVASGELDPDSIKAEMGRRAKAQYSYLGHVIDAGGTLKEYFDPHRKTIAQLMEVAPDKIDFLNDPQWSNVINRPPDSNDTTRREMTLSETEAFVRSKEQWSTTQNARSTAANGAAAIAKALGAL
jgi:hypothetical protein